MRASGSDGFVIPAEMNSDTDWAKCPTTLCGNHFINWAAKIIKLCNCVEYYYLQTVIINIKKINPFQFILETKGCRA